MLNERILDLTGISDSWNYWASQADHNDLGITLCHYFSTFALSLNMAREGRGISLGQSTLVESSIKRGDLVCPFELPVDELDHYFLQQNLINTPHPHANNFVEWVMDKFTNERK